MQTRTQVQSLFFLSLQLALIGCETRSTHSSSVIDDPSQDSPEYTDQYVVDLGNRKMDILFVIDNSASMADQQDILKNSFESFINSFVTRQIDYHIGIISTDNRLNADSPWRTGWGQRFFNAGPSTLLWAMNNVAAGDPAPTQMYLDRSMGSQAVIDLFKNNAVLGADGTGEEAALLSITRFLESDRQAGWNSGFIREGSLFSTVIVSDEDESRTNCNVDPNLPGSLCNQSTGRPAGNSYVFADAAAKEHRLNAFRQSFKALRPDRPSLLRLDGVIVKPTTDGSVYDESCVASGERDGKQGRTYAEIVNEFEGTLSSICGNFAPDIEALGEAISSSIESQFPLTVADVDESTLIVKVNGQELAADQFTYDSASNRVRLSDAYVAGLDLLQGSITVEIRYHQNMVTID